MMQLPLGVVGVGVRQETFFSVNVNVTLSGIDPLDLFTVFVSTVSGWMTLVA